MAVVLRSSSDLLYVPDHGFVGEDGALRILIQVTRQIRRIDVSHNLLGSDGVSVLIKGLTSTRARFSSADFGIWGLRDMNLGSNGVSDEALDAIMGYAKKDVCMRKVWVQGNDIELRHNLESIINALNASRLQVLSLTNNASLLPSSLSTLFRTISAPYLSELHLSTCNLGPTLARPIVAYLRSPRARNLELLELNGNNLGVEGVRGIVDTIEENNFTIKQVGLLANDERPREGEARKTDEERQAEDRALSLHVHQRLPPLLERNRILTRRVRRAAMRTIAPARMILAARPLDDEETARSVIDSVGSQTPIRPFPILDLPREVIYQIVRHCSGDPLALSHAQFTRLRTEAEDRQSMGKFRRIMEERVRKAEWGQDSTVIWEVREDWLRRGKWDKWELDAPVMEDDEESEEEEVDGGEDGMRESDRAVGGGGP